MQQIIQLKQLQLHMLYKEYNYIQMLQLNLKLIITITLINFLKSLTNIAKKVKGTAKLNPNFSGIAAPKIIPKNVVDLPNYPTSKTSTY